jgi:hypothetical protein
MYAHSYYLLTEVEADAVYLSLNERDAGQWIENVKTGSLSFIQPLQTPRQRRVAMEALDLSTQVDVLFELGIPIMQLIERAHIIELQDVSFRVASVEDLIRLKEQRSDRSQTDEDDIRFLKGLLAEDN